MIAYERLAIMILGSTLKKEGHEVRAAVMNTSGAANGRSDYPNQAREPEMNTYHNIFEVVQNFQPEMIGYSAMTGEHYDILELNRKLKQQFDFYAIMGGPHPTFFKQAIEEEGIDAICIGEGDIYFPEFIRRMETKEEYWLTPTMHVKHEGKIHCNPLGDLVPDLSVLPMPDRTLLYESDPNMAKLGTKSVITARGCPYKCSYCFNKAYNDMYKDKGQIIRARTPEQVIQEIEWIKDNNYRLEEIAFVDDIFFLKPQGWLKKFAKLYKKRINLPFNGNVRASSVKYDDIKLLKDAGLSHVWMGVESGDEEAANKVFLRNTTNKTIIKVNNWFREHGVKVISLNIMGLPVDDPYKVDLATLDLNLKLKPALASTGLLYPYPGTAVAQIAVHGGYFDDENPKFLESNKRSSMLKFKSAKEKRKVENLQKLTGLVVEFPFLRRFMDYLCKMPFTGFYHLLFYLHLGYCHKIRLSRMNIRKELPIFIKMWFRLLAKS